ncbi:hypothetical protein SLA2020_214220 [Shorea laevis]
MWKSFALDFPIGYPCILLLGVWSRKFSENGVLPTKHHAIADPRTNKQQNRSKTFQLPLRTKQTNRGPIRNPKRGAFRQIAVKKNKCY